MSNNASTFLTSWILLASIAILLLAMAIVTLSKAIVIISRGVAASEPKKTFIPRVTGRRKP